ALRFLPEGGRTRRPGATAIESASGDGIRQARAWVLRDGKPTAIPVTVGIDDGTSAEIIKGDLAQGDQVIVAEAKPGGRSSGAAGPMRPFFPPGGRPQSNKTNCVNAFEGRARVLHVRNILVVAAAR